MRFLEVGGAVDFRDYLRRKCREQGISLHRLAVRCDLNQIYFYQAVNKNKENPPPWVLRRAAPHPGGPQLGIINAARPPPQRELQNYADPCRRPQREPEDV